MQKTLIFYNLSTFTMQDECVLCCIKIDSNGAIIVKPDFSDSSYIVQTGGFAKGKKISTLFRYKSLNVN